MPETRKKIYLILSALLLSILMAKSFFYFINNQNNDNAINQKTSEVRIKETKTHSSQNQNRKPIQSNDKAAVVKEKNSQWFEYLKEMIFDKKPIEAPQISTKPSPDPGFSFVVIGDSESYNEPTGYNEELPNVLKVASSYNSDFAVFTGDIITTAVNHIKNKSRIMGLKKLIDGYFQKYYLVLAKHDLEGGPICVDYWHEIFWNKKFKPGEEKILYHSFDHKNTHFTILATTYPEKYKYSLDKKQLDWLENDLAQTHKNNKIVFMHVPPVTFFEESAEDCHDLSCEKEVQSRLLGIFQKYNVDLVISGHEHSFEHQAKNGIHYIISGNTGNSARYEDQKDSDVFSLVQIKDQSIKVQAIKVTGQVVKTIWVKKP
ncbi:MAG: hypothetical protein GF335_05180 [Candidatus Moranbacteria bacterium]|nr:hypothetical protein [Candidatus Moranbacteria bacterium]